MHKIKLNTTFKRSTAVHQWSATAVWPKCVRACTLLLLTDMNTNMILILIWACFCVSCRLTPVVPASRRCSAAPSRPWRWVQEISKASGVWRAWKVYDWFPANKSRCSTKQWICPLTTVQNGLWIFKKVHNIWYKHRFTFSPAAGLQNWSSWSWNKTNILCFCQLVTVILHLSWQSGVHRCLTAVYLVVFQVEFSSLDFLLHTKALLSTINYINSAMPPQLTVARDRDTKKQVERSGQGRTGECPLRAHRCVTMSHLECLWPVFLLSRSV